MSLILEDFIISTYKEVLPVKQIDHVFINDGKLGQAQPLNVAFLSIYQPKK
jgi:hypothetical protein